MSTQSQTRGESTNGPASAVSGAATEPTARAERLAEVDHDRAVVLARLRAPARVRESPLGLCERCVRLFVHLADERGELAAAVDAELLVDVATVAVDRGHLDVEHGG